jgi:hypothetical protein
MRRDIAVFNLKRKVESVEEINETLLVNIGTWAEFKSLMTSHFPAIVWKDYWGTVKGKDFSIKCSIGEANDYLNHIIFHLQGNNAIDPLIELCRRNQWQAYDTVLDAMLDIDY